MQYFKLVFNQKTPQQLGRFLMKNGFSHRALTNSRHHGGMMLVNHKRRYSKYLLHTGDEVIFIVGQEKENKWLKASTNPIDIVLETKNYLILNKPAGVLSIPSRYEDDDALVNRVLGYFEQRKAKVKPHVVTRLDRDTSGLVLIGKNSVAHARFSDLGKDRLIKKYHAIVHGNFAENELEGIIDQPIGKKDGSTKHWVLPSGKPSQTKYKVLAQTNDAALVELQLFTGRTHQIRVHMSYIGHPLYGDPLYGIEDNFERQALNCFLLSFDDPFTSQRKEVEVSYPEDMEKLWQEKRSHAD